MATDSSQPAVIRKIISLFLVIAFAVWGASYLIRHPENLTALQNLSTSTVLLLLGLALLKLVAMGMFTWINLAALGVHLGFWEWYGLSAMTAMGNHLIAFRGGAAIRGLYLKSTYDLPYTTFLSTVASLYLLTFPTNALLGLLALLGVHIRLNISQPGLALVLAVALVGPIAFLLLIRHVPHLSGRLGSRLNLLIEGWRLLTAKASTIVKLVLTSILNSSITILMIHVSFHALGVKPSLIESGVLGILYLISAMIPITPAGLGFAETSLVLASSAFGFDSTINILAAGLNRSAILVVSLVLGPLFTMILGRKSGRRLSPFGSQSLDATTEANK